MNNYCPVCGGPGMPLGGLGRLNWFRCRNCGMDFSTMTRTKWDKPKRKSKPAARAADELPERDFYEGDSPDY